MPALTDEQWAAIVNMAQRGIDDAYYYADYVDARDDGEEDGYTDSLRASADAAADVIRVVEERTQ